MGAGLTLNHAVSTLLGAADEDSLIHPMGSNSQVLSPLTTMQNIGPSYFSAIHLAPWEGRNFRKSACNGVQGYTPTSPPQFCAWFAACCLHVQLGKWMLSLNERVPIIVPGLPCWVIHVPWLWIWYNSMLSSRLSAIKEDHLPLVEVFELGPKFFQDLHVTSHASKPTIINPAVSGVPKAGRTKSGYTGCSILGTGNKHSICQGKRPKSRNISNKQGKNGIEGYMLCKKCLNVYTTIFPLFWDNYPKCLPQGAPQARVTRKAPPNSHPTLSIENQIGEEHKKRM